MVQLGKIVGLLLHTTSPACAFGTELANDVDKVDNFHDHLLAGWDVVRQADLALAPSAKDDVCDLKFILELLKVNLVSFCLWTYKKPIAI